MRSSPVILATFLPPIQIAFLADERECDIARGRLDFSRAAAPYKLSRITADLALKLIDDLCCDPTQLPHGSFCTQQTERPLHTTRLIL